MLFSSLFGIILLINICSHLFAQLQSSISWTAKANDDASSSKELLESCLSGTSHSFVQDTTTFTVEFFGDAMQNTVTMGIFSLSSSVDEGSYYFYPLTDGTYCSAIGADRSGSVTLYCSETDSFSYVDEHFTCVYDVYLSGPRYCASNYDSSSCKYTGDDPTVGGTIAVIIAAITVPLVIICIICIVVCCKYRQKYYVGGQRVHIASVNTIPVSHPPTTQVNLFQPAAAPLPGAGINTISTPPHNTTAPLVPQYTTQYPQPGQTDSPSLRFTQQITGQYGQPTVSSPKPSISSHHAGTYALPMSYVPVAQEIL